MNDGTPFSTLGVIEIFRSGEFHIKINNNYTDDSLFWIDTGGQWAWVPDFALDVALGCELILRPTRYTASFTVLVTPDGQWLIFTFDAASGTGFRFRQ